MIPFTPDDRRAQFAPSQNVGGAVDRDVLDIIGAQPQPTMAAQVDYDVPDIKPVDPDVVDIVNQSQVPLMSSLMGASRVNPDQAAEAKRLGSQVGIGQDIALRNMDEVRQRAFMAEVQRRDIARANPVLAGFLTDRTFANEASDDIGTLDRVGSFFADIGRAAAGRPMEYTAGELVRGYMRGQLVAERGEIGTRAILGEAEETNFARAKQIQQEMRDLTGGGILASTAEVVAQNVAQAREVVGAGLIGGAAGSVVPGIGTMTGFAGGLGTGIVLTTAKMEAGNLYLDLQEQGISDDTAVPIAVGAGLLNGVVEAVGMKIAAAPFRQLASRVMREQIAEAVRKPTMRSALAEAGKAYVVQVGSEAAEEGLQEIVNIAGEELAKGMEGIDSETTMRDAAKRVLDSFVQGAMGGAILGGVGPGANLYVDLRRANKATKQTQFFNDLSQNATESKLKARDPGAYERFVAATAAGTNAETVFVDGATMRDVLTQAGVTDAQLEAIVPGVAQQVRQAAELGNDVTLPTAQFAGRLAGTQLGDALLPHMRLSPDAMSAMEAQQFAQSREALVEEARALLEAKTEAESAFVQEADQVFASMRERLLAAGRDPALADIEALMHQAFVVTQAANRGMTPTQFEAESGLREIVGGMPVVQGERGAAGVASAVLRPPDYSTNAQLFGWNAQWGLASVAKKQGVNLANLTREEYVQFAIDNGFRINDDQLRMATTLRNATSMAEYQALRKSMRAAATPQQQQADAAFSSFAQQIKRDATSSKQIANGIRIRSGTANSDTWLYFKVNSGANITGNTYKAYAGFSNPYVTLTPDRVTQFMELLQSRGYNGDIKTIQDLDQGSSISDQIVMHGATEADARLAQQLSREFFGNELTFSEVGMDSATRSYSQILSDKIDSQIAANIAKPPIATNASAPLGQQAAVLEQANRDIIASVDAELDRVMDAAKESSRVAGKPKSKDTQAAAFKAKQEWIAENQERYAEYQAAQRIDAIERERIREAAESALAGKIDESLATAAKTLTDAGFVLDYESVAPSKSRYYRKGNTLIRLSDHEIPVTPERAAAREAGVQVPYRDFVFDGTAVDAELIQDLEEFAARTSPNIMEQAAQDVAGANTPGVGVANENKLGFWPALRVRIQSDATLPDKPLILTGTTNKNATKQLANIDDILGRFPNAAESPEAWAQMLAYAFGTDDVPVPPYAFIRDTNGDGSFERLSTLTDGQIADATHGFDNAREFRRAYTSGELDVITTGKLFLWSFLSRGVSPYTQESLFIDAFDGADVWIKKAAQGKFTEADFDKYEKWAKSVAPQGSGQPGAGATHNLNAFGKNFLMKMGAIGPDGKSNLQRLHDMMCDPNQTGKQIRREFATFGEGVGIDNKVVSFTLLVAGFNDVMVLDRVQVRQLWDDGRFSDTNLYDGVNGADGKKIAGSSLNAITEGVRGILIYEAIERQLNSKINEMYTRLGRPQDGSIGRYHWETWVAYSQQEAAHATLDAILLDAKGDDQAISKVSGKQGEYGAYEYGTQYNRDQSGTPWFRYVTPLGGTYDFSVPAFRQFLTEIKKPANKVVPTKFKVTESGNAPWYTRPEVNQQQLEEQAAKYADRGGGTGEGTRLVREAAENADAIRARSGAGVQPAGRAGVFEQAARGPARGGYDPSRLKILFGKGADFTTGAHELTHYYVDYYTKQAMAGTATPQMLADLDAMFKFMGVAGDTPEARLAAFNAMPFETARPLIETITYNAEVYLFEGKAPSLELAGVFDRMLAFFRRAYKSLADFVTQQQEIYRREFGRELPALNDDLRAVFDRMLADERQIKQAQAVAQMRGQFTVKPEGMDDAEWAAYQEMAGEATNAAIADMTKASLRQMEWLSRARNRIIKDLQARHTAQRKEVRERVQKEVQQEPLYRAMAFLRRGQVVAPDGTVTEAEGVHKIDRVLAAEFAPTVDLAALGGRYGVLQDDGLHPDIVAEMFGYPTGGTLLEALAAAKPMREAVEDRTDAEMLRLYGEMNTPEAREQEIQKALHNEARARLVGVELRFMGKIQQPVRVLMEAARQAAQQVIDRKRVGELRPSEFVAAEAKASREATAAMQDNKPDVAVRAKRAQLLNNQLAKAALEVKDEIDTDIRYLRRVLRDSNRQRMGADVADQIAKLLSRVNIAPMTLAESRRIGTLAKFLALLEARGIVPDIAEAIGMTDDSIPYKNMTIGEFRDLVDAVKQLEYVGKNERKILIAKEKAEFETVRDEIVKSVVENAGDRKDNARTATTNIGRAVTAMKGFAAAHLKAASIVRILDGGKDGGPLWNYLIRSANEAGDSETSMRAEATADLTKILEPVFRAGKLGGKGVFYPSINRSLNREARLVVALNMGNAGNIQRLLDGEGWSMEAVMPVLQSLTEDELNTVQQIWDYFEKYRPMIGQKERRLYGKEPSWVEPQPLVVRSADGKTVTLRGGYYPIKYDPRASLRAETMSEADEAKRDLAGAYTTATTRRSFVKARVRKVEGRPLLYTLAGMYGGINDVIHDLTWHEWLIQANRLMRSNSFDDAVRNRYGPEYVAQLKNWIKDVAAGERGMQNEAEMALNFLRQGISSAGLGFNIVSAAMQITGFNQSIVRVGARWIGRGIAYVAQNPMVAMREVNEKSEFMRNRSRTQFRELNEIRNMVQGQSVAMRRVQMGTYFLMMRMQRMVDVPTWHGAYEKAMYEGRDEETAIALADQAVIDSQGGGMVKDLARVERGGPAVKLFTVFYGYMNTVYNMAAVQTMTNKNKGKLAADYAMLFVVPVVLAYMLKQALIPRKGDEEEEWDMGKIGRELAAEQLSYLMGTMVIAREFGEVGKMIFGVEGPRMGYGGPAGLRAIGETYQFATQASQGEFDTAFRKSAVNMIGAFTGLPSAQVNRTLDGLEALYEGETKNVLAPLTGVKKR